MVRIVILPSLFLESKMSSWCDMLSYNVHFLKYTAVIVNTIIFWISIIYYVKIPK